MQETVVVVSGRKNGTRNFSGENSMCVTIPSQIWKIYIKKNMHICMYYQYSTKDDFIGEKNIIRFISQMFNRWTFRDAAVIKSLESTFSHTRFKKSQSMVENTVVILWRKSYKSRGIGSWTHDHKCNPKKKKKS